MAKPKFTDAEIEEALRASGGVYTFAAALIEKQGGRKCAPNTVRNAVQRSPRLQEVLRDCREQLVDLCEHNIIKGIRDGDKTYTIFALKCFGRDRGWAERLELTGENGGPLRTQEQPPFDYSQLSDDELVTFRDLCEKATGPQSGARGSRGRANGAGQPQPA